MAWMLAGIADAALARIETWTFDGRVSLKILYSIVKQVLVYLRGSVRSGMVGDLLC